MTVLSLHRTTVPFSITRSRLGARVHRTASRMETRGSQSALLVASSSVGVVAVALSAFGLALIH